MSEHHGGCACRAPARRVTLARSGELTIGQEYHTVEMHDAGTIEGGVATHHTGNAACRGRSSPAP